LADFVRLQSQSSVLFNTGRFRRESYSQIIQPAVPIQLGENWNLLTRPIFTVPDPPVGRSDEAIG
jgi:hypothetical protein